MNLFSSPANDSPGAGRKFVPGLGWIDLSGGLDKYIEDPLQEISENPREASPEFGWDEVHQGLGQILIGQIIWGVCALLVVILGWLLSSEVGPTHPLHVASDFKNDFKLFWLLFTGLIAAVGFRFLLAGKWRCLLNAPERNGLRWIMFACITGIVTAPIFDTTAFITTGPLNGEMVEHDVVFVKKAKLNTTQTALQLAGAGSVLISSIALLLFFRRTAQSFEALKLMRVIDFSFLALIPLLAITLTLFFDDKLVARHPILLTAVEFGWLCWMILHFLLNLRTRHCIEKRAHQHPEPALQAVVPSWQPQ